VLLPYPLYLALAPHLGTHRCWHFARFDAAYELRKKFPGECDAQLFPRSKPGSGCDFLAFHRRMVRHFKWLIANTPGQKYRYKPWPMLPDWLESLLRADGFDPEPAYRTIADLAANGTMDELGGFIEPSAGQGGRPGAGIHNRIHEVIAKWESDLNPGDDSSSMADMGTAPANVFFWKLHGWIDEWYARWQLAHGQTPDQSPNPTHDPHVDCDAVPPPASTPAP
jgi:hypothetical protein